jgi:hypothetical protein
MFALILLVGLLALIFSVSQLVRIQSAARGSSPLWLRTKLWLAFSLLALLLLLAGCYFEYWGHYYQSLHSWLDSRLYHKSDAFQVQGDPGLAELVRLQQPGLARPSFEAVKEVLDWQDKLRETLLQKLFELDLTRNRTVHSETLASLSISEHLTRYLINFTSFDGTKIPAYVFQPESSQPLPAILVLPGHGPGLAGPNLDGESPANRVALALAKKGFVVMALELRGFGYLGPVTGCEHRVVAHNALLAGSFYKAVICQDIKLALDYLAALPQVAPRRMGISGGSLGGEIAITYSALDPRVKVVVCQGYGGEEIGVKLGLVGSTLSPAPHFCHLIPGQNKFMRPEDLFLLIAPRPLLVVRGTQEEINYSRLKSITSEVYDCLAFPANVEFRTMAGDHDYFLEPAQEFFKKHL